MPVMNDSAISFDIDWAPDFAIQRCADICRRYNAPATFYVTHRSPILAELIEDPLFDVGIHPNFLPGSTHGRDLHEVMDHCLELVPTAQTMRAHSLYQSSRLHVELVEKYSCIESEVSLFLPAHQHLAPVFLRVCEDRPPLLRLPYFWADDIAATDPAWRWNQEMRPTPGLKIFAFHPMHIALNTDRLARLWEWRRLVQVDSPCAISESSLDGHENRGLGSRTFLEALLQSPLRPFRKMSEIAAAAKGHRAAPYP